ncbi:class I SAM-dependent methyltransferase [Nakamurella endophytica]|uniref:Class I SAM-dependent methyltransferase n=1 Tax=Nakamurella endophytica TaxID=1748367 RepID=A0A917WFD9_9ACTN|nr:class I SAM-dependent methyltransferase [Nakamurella endophytica]GGM02295.1 hypothetical protein GCM10011594_22970 [Nakamurella endophytica]
MDGAASDTAGGTAGGAADDGAGPTSTTDGVELAVRALLARADGDADAAVHHARAAAAAGSLLGHALSRYLDPAAGAAAAAGATAPVYDAPAAFQAFVDGGGNVELYRRTSAALAAVYRRAPRGRVLDLGCGDGLAVVPAVLAAGDAAPASVDLVEPSAALLADCRARCAAAGLAVVAQAPTPTPTPTTPADAPAGPTPTDGRGPAAGTTVRTWQTTAQQWLGGPAAGQRWDVVESTFALQSLPPADRAAVLSAVADRAATLAVVEFDVPPEPATPEDRARSLARRYEHGIAEYGADRDLVTQGFLVPVLLGLVDPAASRTNWEHPAATWAADVAAAGWTDVRVEPVADYWYAPAFLLTARSGTRG